MSKKSIDDETSNKNDQLSLTNKTNEVESTEESSLLNSIVEAVMRGDMNQVVTLALSHRSSDQKVKSMVDQALSSAISNKARLTENNEDEGFTNDSDLYSHNIIKSTEDVAVESSVAKSPNTNKQNCTESPVSSQNMIYSQRRQPKSKENNNVPCTYYFSNDPIISSNCTNIDSSSNAALYCQSGYAPHNADLDNHTEDSINGSLSQYQITNSSLQNVESINNLNLSQQSVQVQLPGIGNFLLQIPSNFKPGEPITLPLNLPLTPVSQTSGVNPISIHMNTGQLMSNQLLSLYNPSSNLNITAGKKMRAIAPKPSKPTYRQPLIAPKTNSPNTSAMNQDGININSTPLPAPSGTGRRKSNKGKKSGRKRGAPAKSHKNSSYASSTHSIDSQDASQFNETSNSMKQNCNNSMSTRSTYQCNYYVNNDSSDYLNQSHVTISQSFNEINSNTLLDNSDSGEKDLLSLAWEISNAELGNPDDFTTAYNLYDANNLGTDSFVSSEILDQFLQNIQKDDITELTRCSSTQINMDSRVSYASSFTTLPPCSTVLPSVTTSTYLNNYSNNSSNIELPQCIEIAEVVNLNTEDMLSELEKEENALLDKFVAQYGTASQSDLIRCDSQTVIPVSIPSSTDCNEHKNNNDNTKEVDSDNRINSSNEDSEKELDLNIKESNELSEIAKQIEISCSSSHQNIDCTLKSKIYTICDNPDNQSKVDCFSKTIDNTISDTNFQSNVNNSLNFCAIPNTSLELIYSSNAETSLIDEKTQCLMSLNFDSKRPNESSFYITDSSLKSKTLDDFGLFEFCTDGEISLNIKNLNHESVDIIGDDDNKYIEPPILEDISDATPIQSDNESEDEDIDELAFKFSKFRNFTAATNQVQNEQIIRSHKLYYNETLKYFSDFDYIKKNDLTSKQSNRWYIGVNDIEIIDIFSPKANLEIKEKHLLNEIIGEKDRSPVENLMMVENLEEISNTSISDPAPIECLDNGDNNNDSSFVENDSQKIIPQYDNDEICLITKSDNENQTRVGSPIESVISEKIDVCETQSNPDILQDVRKLDDNISDIEKPFSIGKIDESEIEIIEEINHKNNTTEFQKIKDFNSKIHQKQNEMLIRIRKQRNKERKKNNYKVPDNSEETNIDEDTDKESAFKLVSDINHVLDRQRRLRKPPKKLAIYQSINFIEKEFSTENMKKIETKKDIGILENPKSNAEFKRCTRSKGTISKSFDSFYEAISRHHKISSKSKNRIPEDVVSNSDNVVDICPERPSEDKSIDNYIDANIINNNSSISCINNETLSKSQTDEVISDPIESDKAVDCLSNTIMTSETSNCLNSMKYNYKNSNIIRKYNLRKNSVSIEHIGNPLEFVKSSSRLRSNKFMTDENKRKIIHNNNTVKHKAKIVQDKKQKNEIDGNLCENVREDLEKSKGIVNNAIVQNCLCEYDSIDSHFTFLEFKGFVTENVKDIADYPSIDTKSPTKAIIVENKCCMDNYVSELLAKKFYPVRKINKKLRMFSGLEVSASDTNTKYASIIDWSPNEIPTRFQCGTQFAKITTFSNPVTYESQCNPFIPNSFYPVVLTQNNGDDLPVSDTDDVESLDAPLVIVEIDEVSLQPAPIKSITKENNFEIKEVNDEDKLPKPENLPKPIESPVLVERPKISDVPKTYSLRTKCRQTIPSKSNLIDKKEFISQKLRRPLFNRACKKTVNNKKICLEKLHDRDIINKINLRTPVCAIEKLSHNDIIANLSISPPLSVDYNEIGNSEESTLNLERSPNKFIDKNNIVICDSIVNKDFNCDILKKVKAKLFKKFKVKRTFSIYKILKKSIWRKTLNRIFNYKVRSKEKFLFKCLRHYRSDLSKLDTTKLVEQGIAQLVIQSKDHTEGAVDNEDDDNELINVENSSPNNQFNTYLDSNNVETFSRNYGSFSLKIKVQKKDPTVLDEVYDGSKRHKKNSKKRKKLRHFLSSIIGSDDAVFNKLNSSEELGVICNKISDNNTDRKRKSRKRKYSVNRDEAYCEVYNNKTYELQDNVNNELPPNLTPESGVNEESQYQKPIKIKLFKSTSEDLTKSDGSSFNSEKVVFSLQKSESGEKKECPKSAKQKILQIVQDLPSKQCRQAANLAKKKIFSTAKEDRRSQNATLTSIWNSKKPNNGTNKTASDILTIYQNYRGKRPRGRPPKLGQSLFISEKQASSTGTLKLKIKLSKDFKNCNNDSNSSNGENSGRTSTNDSSILNSAVAGINGPSDALSLESNNFINGITEQLDQNIEYLEAKEAKVYFDPNQVDIERIKNSYYSSKKTNPESFNAESHQRLYENSIADISNKKSDIISNNRNFSQYRDLDSVESSNLYSNILSKENSSNNKISHLPKEDMNISDNCYANIITSREPQNLSQTNPSFPFENQLSSLGKNQADVWQNSKTNSSDSLTSCRNNNGSWFSEHRNMRDPSFQNSNSILYNSYMTSPVKESKNCISQNQNPPFIVCENENSDSKLVQRSPSKRSTSSEDRKSGSNSFSLNESHNQLSPHYMRGGIGSVPSQLNIHPWSDEPNHNASLNHTAAAWMTYAQQQAAAAAYMDPQMKAYYNLALSQSMLNNPYCGSYGNPAANSENFYSSLHSQYLNNSKDANDKLNITNSGVRNHNDPMGSFMEAAQMSSWEHFYSAAAMAGYHNSSQGTMDDYTGRAGNMLQAHHMLANGYPGSMLGRDHFALDTNKPPLAHQNQSGATSPIKLTAPGSTPVSSSQAYSHVQMPYSHFSGTTVGFF